MSAPAPGTEKVPTMGRLARYRQVADILGGQGAGNEGGADGGDAIAGHAAHGHDRCRAARHRRQMLLVVNSLGSPWSR